MTLSVYRFFRSAEHADAFARGEVLLSTLATCRDYTDPDRGDPGEALHGFDVDCSCPPSETELVAMARALAPPVAGAHVANAEGMAIAQIRDAYLVSTSAEFDPETMRAPFGAWCVEIRDARAFFDAVTGALAAGLPLLDARWGPVHYRERIDLHAATPPEEIGFIKPRRYERQQEVRFLWSVDREGLLLPLTLQIPQVARLSRRLL
jgi:hypothetical protein